MVAFFRTIVRALVVTAALALAAPVADAAQRTTEPVKAAPAEPKSQAADTDGVQLDGLLIITGIVVLVVFVAWLASRMGDNKPHVMG